MRGESVQVRVRVAGCFLGENLIFSSEILKKFSFFQIQKF